VTEFPGLLDELHRKVAPHGELIASPSGHVVASIAALPHAPSGPLARLGLAVVRVEPDPTGGAGAAAERFATGLLELHHCLLSSALRQLVVHLGGRTSGDTALLGKQLVQGQLAEIALSLHEYDPDIGPRGFDSRWLIHRRWLAAGRRLLELFGASGFLSAGPGSDVYLAEFTGNVYLNPEPGAAG
jgi:hypothetical protein